MTSTCRNSGERRGQRRAPPNICSSDLVCGSRRYCGTGVRVLRAYWYARNTRTLPAAYTGCIRKRSSRDFSIPRFAPAANRPGREPRIGYVIRWVVRSRGTEGQRRRGGINADGRRHRGDSRTPRMSRRASRVRAYAYRRRARRVRASAERRAKPPPARSGGTVPWGMRWRKRRRRRRRTAGGTPPLRRAAALEGGYDGSWRYAPRAVMLLGHHRTISDATSLRRNSHATFLVTSTHRRRLRLLQPSSFRRAFRRAGFGEDTPARWDNPPSSPSYRFYPRSSIH